MKFLVLFIRLLMMCLLWSVRMNCAQSAILTTLDAYENIIKAHASSITRVQSIDVARWDDNTGLARVTPFCNLVMMMPFSGFRPTRTPLRNGVFEGMAAVLLAVEHLNTGNGTIVQQIEHLNERCDIKFTTEIFDSSLSQIEAVDQIIDIISRDPNATSHTGPRLPCAFIGAARSAVSIPMSLIAGLRGFPQISPISTSTQLDDVSQFKLFGRTVPSDAGTAVPAILYLRYELGVQHLAVLHVNDAYGNAYALGLQLAAAEYAPDMVIRSYDFPFELSAGIVERTIALLKNTQFRYFFGIFFSTVHYDPFMTEAYDQGIAGTGEHNWMFSDAVSTSVFSDSYEIGSPLHLASRGTSRIGAVGGVPGIEIYDLFLRSMSDLNNPRDMDFIQSKHPTYPKEPDYEPLRIEDDAFFPRKSTAAVVPFLYDAVIALELAACGATKDDTYFDGPAHFETFKTTTFEGASGSNVYDLQTGTRIAASARFTLLNFVEDDTQETDSTSIRLRSVETDVFRDEEWVQVEHLVFNDGTAIPPPDLPPVEKEDNFIGAPLRGVGLGMSGLIICLSLGFAAWTFVNRNSRVVKASQPIFLYMITGGCFLMGSSIIFLSFDDETVSADLCSAFCIVVPWLVSFGWILSFSALFTKTNRVNQIFHNPTHKGIKVTVLDVMKPVLALVTIAGIILATWTALEPPTWKRQVSEIDLFGREVETKGFCSYDGGVPYVSVLAVVLLGVLAYAIYEAYVARKISTEFAESEYIFLVLCAILLVSFLGIPVLIIAQDESRARFFVAAGIVFIICFAILLLIFAPKVIALHRGNYIESVEFLSTSRPATSRASMRHRVSISGVDPQSQAFAVSQSLQDDGDDDGIRILEYPKEVEDLKRKIANLESKMKRMQVQKDHESPTATEPAHPEKMPLVSSIDMVSAISQVDNHSKDYNSSTSAKAQPKSNDAGLRP